MRPSLEPAPAPGDRPAPTRPAFRLLPAPRAGSVTSARARSELGARSFAPLRPAADRERAAADPAPAPARLAAAFGARRALASVDPGSARRLGSFSGSLLHAPRRDRPGARGGARGGALPSTRLHDRAGARPRATGIPLPPSPARARETRVVATHHPPRAFVRPPPAGTPIRRERSRCPKNDDCVRVCRFALFSPSLSDVGGRFVCARAVLEGSSDSSGDPSSRSTTDTTDPPPSPPLPNPPPKKGTTR